MEAVQIHHIEAGERDSLKHHQLEVRAESRLRHESGDVACRIRAVPPHPTADHALQPESGKYDPHQPDIAAMIWREGTVVEADDVRKRR